jgi:hypothetical protein
MLPLNQATNRRRKISRAGKINLAPASANKGKIELQNRAGAEEIEVRWACTPEQKMNSANKSKI